jgi:lecithin-cholesterol acyltransferase
MKGRIWTRIAALATFVSLTGLTVAANASPACRAPVVLFPAFHFTKLEVVVNNQTTAPECPRSGTFQDWFLNDQPSPFNQVCRDKLLTLRYNPNLNPMPRRFSEQPGVTVRILNYGQTSSAPFYESLYTRLEAEGYVRDRNIRVAGYDSRLTPDMGDFLSRTMQLVERTYRDNGNQRVELVGHSNGPLYAQYLLTHTSQSWRDKFIHGFTPIAGNFPGQGIVYSVLFTGLNTQDFTYPTTVENAVSSARMYLSAPSSYMSSADPAVFGNREVVVTDLSTGRSYTPADFPRLFADARLPDAAQIAQFYIGFVKFTDRRSFPEVDVHAEKGSGIETAVGARLDNLSVGQLITPDRFLTRDGDINQEDITNDAVAVWDAMRCHFFSLTNNPGVDHFSLSGDANVLNRLVTTLRTRPTVCI